MHKKEVVLYCQELWRKFEETGDIWYCHAINARLSLAAWEWSNGIDHVENKRKNKKTPLGL